MTTINLILINDLVEDTNLVIDSLKENTKYFVLQSDTNIESISQYINSLNVSSIENVGIMQHGDVAISLGTEKLSLDSPIDLSVPFIIFLKYIKDTYMLQNLDIISCNMLDLWKDSFAQLESLLSINVRASNDDTGNLKVGGDWVQESDNIKIDEIYFNENIYNYQHVLSSYRVNYYNPGNYIQRYTTNLILDAHKDINTISHRTNQQLHENVIRFFAQRRWLPDLSFVIVIDPVTNFEVIKSATSLADNSTLMAMNSFLTNISTAVAPIPVKVEDILVNERAVVVLLDTRDVIIVQKSDPSMTTTYSSVEAIAAADNYVGIASKNANNETLLEEWSEDETTSSDFFNDAHVKDDIANDIGNDTVVKMAANAETFALITDTGKFYSWGRPGSSGGGYYGPNIQNGLLEEHSAYYPNVINILDSNLDEDKVIDVEPITTGGFAMVTKGGKGLVLGLIPGWVNWSGVDFVPPENVKQLHMGEAFVVFFQQADDGNGNQVGSITTVGVYPLNLYTDAENSFTNVVQVYITDDNFLVLDADGTLHQPIKNNQLFKNSARAFHKTPYFGGNQVKYFMSAPDHTEAQYFVLTESGKLWTWKNRFEVAPSEVTHDAHGIDVSNRVFTNIHMISTFAVVAVDQDANIAVFGGSLGNFFQPGSLVYAAIDHTTGFSVLPLPLGGDYSSILNNIHGQTQFVNGLPFAPYMGYRNLYFGNYNLENTILTGTDFSGADLTNVNFSGADLTNVNFTGATLTGATLTGTVGMDSGSGDSGSGDSGSGDSGSGDSGSGDSGSGDSGSGDSGSGDSGSGVDTVSGSSSGDPYLNTINNVYIKLPDIRSNYRLLDYNGLIINGSVDILSEKEFKEQVEMVPNNVKDILLRNQYYYTSFYINYKGESIHFDAKLNVISKSENNTFNIIEDNKFKLFKCPIQGKSAYTSKSILIKNVLIRLDKHIHPQIRNGINITIFGNDKTNISGLFNSSSNPKFNRINNIRNIRKIKYGDKFKTSSKYGLIKKELRVSNNNQSVVSYV